MVFDEDEWGSLIIMEWTWSSCKGDIMTAFYRNISNKLGTDNCIITKPAPVFLFQEDVPQRVHSP
jgi:hypothetical protein